MTFERKMLLIGASMPVVYFIVLFLFGFINPEFSHIRQAPSDLGAGGEPYKWKAAFNFCLIIVGTMGVIGGAGLFKGLGNLGFDKTMSTLVALTVIMPSINMMLSGINPLPHPQHSLLELLFPIFFTPLLGAIVVRRISKSNALTVILIFGFIANLIIFMGVLGIGDFVTDENLGLWIRIWLAIVLPATGYLCWFVRDKLVKSP